MWKIPGRPRSTSPAHHDARFTSGLIFFTWVTGGRYEEMPPVFRRLLRSDLVEAISTSSGSEVWLSRRYKKLDRLMTKAGSLRDLDEELTSGTVRMRDFAIRHPGIAAGLMLRLLKGQLDQGPAPEQSTAEAMEELIRSTSQRIAELQAPSAVLHAVERETFSPSHLERSPWARILTLPCAVHCFDEQEEPSLVTPLISMHAGGVVMVTFPIRLPPNSSSGQVADWERADRVPVLGISLPHRFAKIVNETDPVFQGRFAGDPDEHGWVYLAPSDDADEELHLTHVWEIYSNALTLHGLDLFHEWLCYPTVFLMATDCCQSHDDWVIAHDTEIAALLAKRPHGQPTRAPTTWKRPADSSFSPDSSLWHSNAITLSVEQRDPQGDREWDLGERATVLLVVQAFLVQFWTLRILRELLPEFLSKGIKGIRLMQVRLIMALEEFDHPIFSYQTAHEAVRSMLNEGDADRAYQKLRERVGDLASLAATVRTERIARRNLQVAGGALAAAILLGLPSLSASLTLLSRVPGKTPAIGPLLAPVRNPDFDEAVVAVWIALVIATSVCLFALTRWVWRRRSTLVDQIKRARRLPLHQWSGGSVRIVRSSTGSPPSEPET